jgi:hypothetical protein
MNSFETLEAGLKAKGYEHPVWGVARMILNKQVPRAVRIGVLRGIARDYPLPGGAQPTKEALSAFLEQLDAADDQEREETGGKSEGER